MVHHVTNRRVLVIDDDFDTLDAIGDVLSMEGYEVRCVRSAKDALAQMSQIDPAIIVLDLMMPEMNGWEFLAIRKSDESLSNIPVLVLSADNRSLHQALEFEATEYVAKPIDLDALLNVIARIVDGPSFEVKAAAEPLRDDASWPPR